MEYQLFHANCLDVLCAHQVTDLLDLTFLDPPFNQGKHYSFHKDNLPHKEYWQMMEDVCQKTFELTTLGGGIYFMQREKNAEYILRCLRKTGWSFQNLIIWKKTTSAIPSAYKFGKHYQILAYATKGQKAKTFNRLRINPPLPAHYKVERASGIYVTDIWEDIRELTSGYFAGEEAIRNYDHERFHKQQTPVALLLRIILSSSQIGDLIFDPFAGTGTTLVVAHQLRRRSIGIEIDHQNIQCIKNRLEFPRDVDSIDKFYTYYEYTDHLETIWRKKPREPTHLEHPPSILE